MTITYFSRFSFRDCDAVDSPTIQPWAYDDDTDQYTKMLRLENVSVDDYFSRQKVEDLAKSLWPNYTHLEVSSKKGTINVYTEAPGKLYSPCIGVLYFMVPCKGGNNFSSAQAYNLDTLKDRNN